MNVKIIDRTERPLETVYKAYRVCYSKDVPTEIEIPLIRKPILYKSVEVGREYVPDYEKMIEFIKDKIELNHLSPLEHCSFTFAIEGVSRALSHQLVRHRTMKFSQQSQRYVDGENFDFAIPDNIKNNDGAMLVFNKTLRDIKFAYKNMIDVWGIDKEDARAILPNATTTNLIVTCDLRNFRNFLAERLCKNAQSEIRELAEKMLIEAEKIVPFAGYKARKCGITCFECKEK